MDCSVKITIAIIVTSVLTTLFLLTFDAFRDETRFFSKVRKK